ncbi:Serine/arginine repetitive matrix protein 2 [Polyplax serrata]|uniref:Serine/arginine repetitive matrix protein 2 n=1 Tax=Polyplax serrata TaxID=468196 RepID=A0AAN8S8M1_POLSC
MYNGIGLQTPRGSGTNGYVQRNWAFVRKTKDKVHYKTEEELEKLEANSTKQPNKEILDHQRKRKTEIKCMELEEVLEDQGYSKEEISEKVAKYRDMLNATHSDKKSDVAKDEFGRVMAGIFNAPPLG